MTFTQLLEQCCWAGTLVLLAAFAAAGVLRRAPAAWRHFLWTAVLAGLLVLPAVVRVTPKWGLETATPLVAAGDSEVVSGVVTGAAPVKSYWNPFLLCWLTGCAAAAGWFLVGRWRIRLLVRGASEAGYARDLMDAAGGRGVKVLESSTAPTAMAVGIWRPRVVLPADAREWPVERLRAILLHELMHVRRRDLAAQALAHGACCLYWFHPLAWMAALQLRRERERACDDAVLGRGMAAHAYAGHLVALVRALRGRRSAAMTMAEPSELESRVRALLDGTRDRRPLNRSAALAMVAALAVLVFPLAVITVRAQAAAPVHTTEAVAAPVEGPGPQVAELGSLSGTVEDPSAARIPNSEVRARNLDAPNEEITHADAAGAFRFASIPVGRYEVSVRSAGFKLLTARAVVEANQTSTVAARLTLGEMSEVVTVSAARASAPAAIAAPADPRRIRVGGMVQPGKLLYKVNPIYPEALKAKGISGIVHLRAILTKQGYLSNLQVLNTDIDPGLAAAAMEAAAHWLYQPSLLNGEPVAVLTNIDISFELQ